MTEISEKFKRIRELAKQGIDMFNESGQFEDYTKMAEWMRNQFMFILWEVEENEENEKI